MSDGSQFKARFKEHVWLASWALFASGISLAFISPFFDAGAGTRFAIASAAFIIFGGVLIWSGRETLSLFSALDERAEVLEAEAQRMRSNVLNLQEACQRMELDRKNSQEEWKEATREHSRQLAEAEERFAAANERFEALKAEREPFLAEQKRLEGELSESLMRRQALEGRSTDLDRRLAELRDAYGGDFAQIKEARQEVLRLGENIHALQAELQVHRDRSVKLQRELEVVTLERSNSELRQSQLERDLGAFRSRAEGAEKTVQYLEADRPAEEELAARRRENERLLANDQILKRECQALKERAEIIEAAKSALAAKASEYEAQAAQTEVVISELHQRLRERLVEAKGEVPEHFVWKVNYFRDNEVTLNFINRGIPIDLIEATSKPALSVELSSGQHLGRNEEGRVKFSSRQTLPQEFVVKVRFTAFAQEASFRIRPFQETKIERL